MNLPDFQGLAWNIPSQKGSKLWNRNLGWMKIKILKSIQLVIGLNKSRIRSLVSLSRCAWEESPVCRSYNILGCGGNWSLTWYCPKRSPWMCSIYFFLHREWWLMEPRLQECLDLEIRGTWNLKLSKHILMCLGMLWVIASIYHLHPRHLCCGILNSSPH